MSLFVLKFGGTSVAHLDCIQHAAKIVQSYKNQGKDVVVVVSAMAGVTNQLVNFVKTLTQNACEDVPGTKLTQQLMREHDVIVTSGEQVTAGLMALALQCLGFQAKSLLAPQVPIETDAANGCARIQSIDPSRIKAMLDAGIIPVVAGFQGVFKRESEDVPECSYVMTTLGRGGSDTTAVALSAALCADECVIYTDVEGVFTADPRLVPYAKKIPFIGYEGMLMLSENGAKVLHHRCVALAIRYGVVLSTRSSFVNEEGTRIGSFEKGCLKEGEMEHLELLGITHRLDQVKVTFQKSAKNEDDQKTLFPGLILEIMKRFQMAAINIYSIQSAKAGHVTFLIVKDDLKVAQSLLDSIKYDLCFDTIEIDHNVATLTLVGYGLNHNQAVMTCVLGVLDQLAIDPLMIDSTEMKISLTVAYNHLSRLLSLLHETLFENYDKNER